MPAGGDVIELVHEQTYLGQVINNVYFFEAAVVDASLPALAAWFEANVVPALKNVQNNLVTHTNLRLRNIFNLAETYEEPLTGTGNNVPGTVELPSFFAVTARLDHTNGSVRPGFKRWSGVTETTIEDSLVTAVVVGQLVTLTNELVNPPTTPNPDWVHVIVNRVCDQLNPVIGATPRCLVPYRLPLNQAEYNPGYPVTAEVYAQPTTQNSRKWYT